MHLVITFLLIALAIGFIAEYKFISLLIALAFIGLVGWLWQSTGEKEKKRKEEILRKYGDTPEAQSILGKVPWIGQTREQLIDSFGGAEEIERKESARASKEIWKFFYPNTRRIRLKITITNGLVSHIDKK